MLPPPFNHVTFVRQDASVLLPDIVAIGTACSELLIEFKSCHRTIKQLFCCFQMASEYVRPIITMVVELVEPTQISFRLFLLWLTKSKIYKVLEFDEG